MTRLTATLAIGCAGLLVISTPARAQNTYEVKVTLDSSANGELGVIKAVLGTADAGEASPALRGLAAKLAMEFQTSLSDRIDDTDVLTLDDGSMLTLLEGDVLKILPTNCKSFPCAGAVITWGKGHGHPLAIIIRNADGGCVKAIRWGQLKGTQRPLVNENCGGKEVEKVAAPELVDAAFSGTPPMPADDPAAETTPRFAIDRRP